MAGNGGTKPLQARFTAFYNRGTQKYELEQTLQPDEQMWIDIGKLIREHVPDKNGNVLPADLSSGSYQLSELTNKGVGNLFEGKVIYDKTYGHVTYGCAACCGYSAVSPWYNPLTIPFGSTAPNGVNAYNTCDSNNEDVSDAYYGHWTSANHSLATVDYYGTFTGIAVGSTTSSATANLQSNHLPLCPILSHLATGNDNVKPVITSLSPASLNAGDSKKPLTINGKGFGTTATVNFPSGVTLDPSDIAVVSDTQIYHSAVDVAASTYIGPNSITVTANSQTSAPAPFTIDGPDHAIVVSDALGKCSGCTTAVKRTVTLQVIKFSGSAAFVIPIGEVASASGWNCTQSFPGVVTTPCAEGVDTDVNGMFPDSWSIASDGYGPSGCGYNFTTHWQWCSGAKTFATLAGYTHTNAISMNGVINPPTQFTANTPVYP